jgi:transposase InsO family protein
VSELAADGIPVAVSLRVLKLSRQPYYRWRKQQVTESELVEAYRANALFDAHRDDPEFGYRFLAGEAESAGQRMCERTAWRICRDNQWWSVFGKKRGKNGKRPGPPVHDDLVQRDFSADDVNELWLTDITEHPALDRRGQALPLRDQGRVLRPDRGLLHQRPDEGPPRGERPGQRGDPGVVTWPVASCIRIAGSSFDHGSSCTP